jgi:hypothetical protein
MEHAIPIPPRWYRALSNHDHARAVYAAQEFDEIIRHENACMHFHHQCLNVILTYMPAFLPLINIHKL